MILLLHLVGSVAYLLTGYGFVRLLLISSSANLYRKNPGFMGAILALWPLFLAFVILYWLCVGLGKLFTLVGKYVIGSRYPS